MYSALMTIFSGYGIFNLQILKYIYYLDRLVDYQTTCWILELIWAAVGIAICQYLFNGEY